MRQARLALLAVFLPLAVLMKWEAPAQEPAPEQHPVQARAQPTAPRPDLVSRAAWGADEKLVREPPSFTSDVRAVFIHHTNHPNSYDCADAPALLRRMEVTHVRHMGWDDLGYNFVVDKCGTIYEGRGGGANRPVKGAHTRGFNNRSAGIAALGNFGEGERVPQAMLAAIAAVAAWKLRPDADPLGSVRLTSTNSHSRYPEGTTARFDVISGHRDAYETSCPGDALVERLPELREAVARRRS